MADSVKKKSPEKTTVKTDNPEVLECGIIMPISSTADCTESHWKSVLKAIEKAIAKAGFEPKVVWEDSDRDLI